MLRLINHIERLLMMHDCVIVPELGGFVLQSVSADHSAKEHIFRPMHKEVTFNSTLKHQDGLLAESYMKIYSVDYSKACSMIEEDVNLLKARLQGEQSFELGRIGVLSLGEEGQYIFASNEDRLFGIDSYGFPVFHFTPLSELQKERGETLLPVDTKNKGDIYIRINRNFLRATAAAAAAIALTLVLSTPINDIDSSYRASIIPMEIAHTPAATTLAESIEQTQVQSETLPVDTDIAIATAVPQPAPQVRNSGVTYYAVIASVQTEEQARQYISRLDQTTFPNVNYIKKGSNIRIFADKFSNRSEAEVLVESLRATDTHKSAWMHISR
jgi:Sporulation related domain.